MTDRDALYESILANPDDDAPRLVYADWLDENGEPEYGEFVRVQVALARKPKTGLDRSAPVGLFGERERRFLKYGKHRKALRKRERELWSLVRDAIDAGGLVACVSDPGIPQAMTRQEYEGGIAIVRRGFPAVVRLTLAELMGGGECDACRGRGGEDRYPTDDPLNRLNHGSHWYSCPTCHGTGRTPDVAERLAELPLERVELTDREPYAAVNGVFFLD